MKKIVVLLASLALALSVSMAFADEGLTAYLFNKSDGSRTVDARITCSSGAGSMPHSVIAAGGDDHIDFFGHDAEDQEWYFKVSGPKGSIVEAWITYSGGQFQPKLIGEGITYDTFSPTELKLTITK